MRKIGLTLLFLLALAPVDVGITQSYKSSLPSQTIEVRVSHADAAIAFDASASEAGLAANDKTLAITTSGSNRLLVVLIQSSNSGGSNDITLAQYAGVNMTLISFISDLDNADVWVYYILNPAIGANDIHFTSSTADLRRITATSYNGVSQVGFPDATGTGSPKNQIAGTSLQGSITTVADNSWLWMGGCVGSAAVTAGTNTTLRTNSTGDYTTSDSNGAQTPAGAYSLNWSFSLSAANAVYFSFAPAVAATTANFGWFLFQWW